MKQLRKQWENKNLDQSVYTMENNILKQKEHLKHLGEIFTRLKAAGLKLKLEKCCFFKKHIQYLGHLISADGIQSLPENLKASPKCQHQETLKK